MSLILSIPILIIYQKSNIEFGSVYTYTWNRDFGLSDCLIETIADQQKFAFRQNSANDGQFIQTGLWKRVQHPNYLGEILCWIGVFVCAIPSLENWEWLAIISPIWITFLLVFVSGIPLLQKASQKKYGSLKSYQTYQKNTPLLIPFLY